MENAGKGHPVAGVDYPRTYQQLLRWFPDDESCFQYLAGLRWPQGFLCPVCEKQEFWRTGKGLWMCQACGRKTSVTAGTIFHRTRTPLLTWFAAIWFLTSQKNGISAQGLQRVLGFGSYETAWAWMHKLRRAMVRPDRELLTGVVEVDETFIGGFNAGSGGGTGATRCRSWSRWNALAPTDSGGSACKSRPRRAAWNWSISPPRSWPPARPSAPTAPACCAGWQPWGTPTNTSPATTPRTRPASCPACTWLPHCSNAGSSAHCTYDTRH